MAVTGPGTFYEDYTVGDTFRHARGRTITAMDVGGLAMMAMNTSDGHFNDAAMRGTAAGRSIAFGCVTLAIVVGLAMQDTGENATEELALHAVRFREPVVEGDTLTAATRVLDKAHGIVTFEHHGYNQRGETVVTLSRQVRIASADG